MIAVRFSVCLLNYLDGFMNLLQLCSQGYERFMQALDKCENFCWGVAGWLVKYSKVILQHFNLLPIGNHAAFKLLNQLLKIPVQNQRIIKMYFFLTGYNANIEY